MHFFRSVNFYFFSLISFLCLFIVELKFSKSLDVRVSSCDFLKTYHFGNFETEND